MAEPTIIAGFDLDIGHGGRVADMVFVADPDAPHDHGDTVLTALADLLIDLDERLRAEGRQ